MLGDVTLTKLVHRARTAQLGDGATDLRADGGQIDRRAEELIARIGIGGAHGRGKRDAAHEQMAFRDEAVEQIFGIAVVADCARLAAQTASPHQAPGPLRKMATCGR